MVGIESFGVYVPFYRLSHQEIGKTWGKPCAPGEKAVAGTDEDSITMAVEAVLESLNTGEREEIDALYFASTRPPYAQKQSSSTVAAACNLREDINTVDFGNSLRCGTNALRAAIDAVRAGSSRKVVVTASECQAAPGDSEDELQTGDGAAAFVLGSSNVAVAIDHVFSFSSDFMDVWRLPQDLFNQAWEDRYIHTVGYMQALPRAVARFLSDNKLDPREFSKVVYNAPNARYHKMAGKALRLDENTQVQGALHGVIGDTASASAMMMLVQALENARPGDKILVANYGDGVDLFALTVTDQIEKMRQRAGLTGWINSKLMIPTYGKYLHFRDLTETAIDRRPPKRSSPPILYRDRHAMTRLLGKRCNHCGHEQFPRQRICMWCQERMEKAEDYEDVMLVNQKGSLFSYSMDLRAAMVDLPNVNSVVDLEGGARFYGMMTDRDPEKISVGMPMEFTFRKINDAQGVHNYFWKMRPVRR